MHPPDPQFVAELEAEARGWYDFTRLVRALPLEERLVPGYYRDPDWTVRDLAAHLGTWLAEAQIQFERMLANTYEGHGDVDIDALNAKLLDAMRGQPWEVAWIQANAARTQMLEAWLKLSDRTEETEWWIAKAGAPHYNEHLPRLHEWVAELQARRVSTVPSTG